MAEEIEITLPDGSRKATAAGTAIADFVRRVRNLPSRYGLTLTPHLPEGRRYSFTDAGGRSLTLRSHRVAF